MDARDPRLDRSRAEGLFAEWLLSSRGSGAPEFEAWVRQHPELEPELRELERQRRALAGVERELASSAFLGAGRTPSRPPARLDEFECLRRIGAGGMG
jgi:hypothetical protein